MVREAIDDFRRVFESHADGVYRYLYRLAGDRHDAEDLLQETFARLWRKRAQYRGEGPLAGYLRRIAYRTYLNARTRIVRRRAQAPLDGIDPVDGNGCPSEIATREEEERRLHERVRLAIEALPDGWRDAFILFRFEGLAVKEIAKLLGLTPKAVEMRLARALKRVAASVKERGR
jgi:RNA polymerase sigma-70 factor (ECF subfamily)